MEMLSEHQCEGWLEGYLLTGRHGFFSCYETFIHIVDSMFNQHAKCSRWRTGIPWRRPIASLNYLLHRMSAQDHNGFSHQDPGFIDHAVNKKAEVIRVYLAAGCEHPALGDGPLPAQPRLRQCHCRRQQPARSGSIWMRHKTLHRRHQHLGLARQRPGHRAGRGYGLLWRCAPPWKLSPQSSCSGSISHLKVRVINVVDLMKLQPRTEHPHGLTDKDLRHPLHHG